MSPNISMNTTHYPVDNGATSLASQQLQLSSLLLMIGFKHLRLGRKSSIFFDLRKAFDLVPHRPLVDKLDNLGLDTCALSWITRYLTNRKQHVVVGGESSLDTPVLSGYFRALCWVHYYFMSTLIFLTSFQMEAHSIFMQMTCCFTKL